MSKTNNYYGIVAFDFSQAKIKVKLFMYFSSHRINLRDHTKHKRSLACNTKDMGGNDPPNK